MDNAFWVQNDVHFPKPLTPLFTSLIMPAMSNGTRVCYKKMKMQIKRVDVKSLHGYCYQSIVPKKKEAYSLKEHREIMLKLIPNLTDKFHHYVQQVFEPFYEKLSTFQTNTLTNDAILEAVQELESFFMSAWEIHYEVLTPKQAAGWILEEMYRNLFGSVDKIFIYELLTGTMNKTLETDKAIWKLARKVKSSLEIKRLFDTTDMEALPEQLAKFEAGKTFLHQLQQVMDEYGYRSANFNDLIEENWVENPIHILGIIKTYVDTDYDFNQRVKDIHTKREKLYHQLLSKVPDSPEGREFIKMIDTALHIWRIEEDHHFYIDAMLPARSRMFFLKVGSYLVDKGLIAEKNDIFFLYIDEVKELLMTPMNVKERMKVRKKQHLDNLNRIPVPFVGNPEKLGQSSELEQIIGFPQEPVNKLNQSFKGSAASKGVYMGTVKVIHSQEDFQQINKGDILVTKTTTPPWTVLFPVVGAIVTDSGGMLSHAGIIAREYGVPAVLGTKVATSILKDGDQVVVDGTNGIVLFNQ